MNIYKLYHQGLISSKLCLETVYEIKLVYVFLLRRLLKDSFTWDELLTNFFNPGEVLNL